MLELLSKHLYYYLPFGLSFMALYLKTVRLVHTFEWRLIGDVISRLLYVLFFGYVTYNVDFKNDAWFSLIAVGTFILFADEAISYVFKRTIEKRTIEECARKVLRELERINWGSDNGHK